MKVIATDTGFYGQLFRQGDAFTLRPRNDDYIKKSRKKESDKKVTSTERIADIKIQFSSKWMKEVKSKNHDPEPELIENEFDSDDGDKEEALKN